MQRVAIVGNSASGKTTLGRALAARLGVPHLELDRVWHQPGWTELPADEFRQRVGDFVVQDGWVVDGNYSMVRDLLWSRADTVVWLDLPRPIVMRRVVARSLSRVVRRTELWQGNRETWRNLLARDPERSIIRWAWTQHDKYHHRYEALVGDPEWTHVRFVRLRHPREVAAFLAAVGQRE